jgi:hypothetical protein
MAPVGEVPAQISLASWPALSLDLSTELIEHRTPLNIELRQPVLKNS